MPLLYANENFPLPVVEHLRELGHHVLTTVDTGRHGRAVPDADVLKFAVSETRAVLTLNRKHFVRLHDETPNHHGIVVCTFDPDFAAQAQRIHNAIGAVDSLQGKLIRVNRPQAGSHR